MEVTLFLDHQCNLHCTYCYNGEKFSRRMPSEVLRAGIDMAVAGATERGESLDVAFFGGEPLLHLDLVQEAVDYSEAVVASSPIANKRVRFLVNTNATLFVSDAVRVFQTGRQAVFFVSVDGPRELHDRFRVRAGGQGSFDAVMSGLGVLRDAHVPYQTVGVVQASSAASLGDAVRALLPLGAAKILLSPNFRDEWTDDNVQALRRGLEDAGNAWMDEFRAGRPVVLEPLHTKILAHLRGGIPCPSRCRLGGREFAVAPSGNIYPCAQMVGEDKDDALTIGHVRTGVDPDRVRGMQQQKDRVERTCAPCALRDRCQSHCGCRHLALTGVLGEITAALCEIEAAIIAEADRVATELHAEKCPAFMDQYYRRSWAPASGSKLVNLRRARGR